MWYCFVLDDDDDDDDDDDEMFMYKHIQFLYQGGRENLNLPPSPRFCGSSSDNWKRASLCLSVYRTSSSAQSVLYYIFISLCHNSK